ncbi:MAG: hypothetical protein PHQ59_01560 [Candidatus Daviesbacteria bacterium]|nr:hypothetical protein [Candidatus Daviesbacteria bacterium]
MSKGNVITGMIFLVLGVVVTYVASLIEILISGKVLSGASGFPFRYGYSSFFGGIFIADSASSVLNPYFKGVPNHLVQGIIKNFSSNK